MVLEEDISAQQQRGKQLDRKTISRQRRPSRPSDGGLQQEDCREDGEKGLEPEQSGREKS